MDASNLSFALYWLTTAPFLHKKARKQPFWVQIIFVGTSISLSTRQTVPLSPCRLLNRTVGMWRQEMPPCPKLAHMHYHTSAGTVQTVFLLCQQKSPLNFDRWLLGSPWCIQTCPDHPFNWKVVKFPQSGTEAKYWWGTEVKAILSSCMNSFPGE